MDNHPKYCFETVTERDMDMLIMLLCGESNAFLDLLLEPLQQKAASVHQIIHSQTHPEYGESDITVIVQCDDRRIGILIEDKIDAIAMPDQAARYEKRARLGRKCSDYDDYIIYIFAPKNYLDNNPEAQKYPHQFSYEALLAFIEYTKPNCYEFVKALIIQALYKEKSGYTVVEDALVTQFWKDFYTYLCENASDVIMPTPIGAKGKNATWISFYHNLKHASLIYKTNAGYLDLEFTGTAHCKNELKNILKPYVTEPMMWAETGKSMSLRLVVPKMDVHQPFRTYIGDMPDIISAIRTLISMTISINNDGVADHFMK